ncbi:MAG: phosphoadenylyl-sulfate reductase [Coriobacteriia bacterium]
MNDDRERIAGWNEALVGASAGDVLAWAAETFPGRVGLASSLGIEDQVLTAMIAGARLPIGVFTLDTGRLFPEAYDLMHLTSARYALPIRLYSPDASEVEEMVALHGVNLFRDSVAARRRCCEVRKVRPLRRALAGLDAWLCGLRSGQGVTREHVDMAEWDAVAGIVKVNPLARWTEDEVWAFAHENDVPYNPLHDRGFPSIGCAPCTRAVEPGEDPRSGRWWWESAEHGECGLHDRGGGR